MAHPEIFYAAPFSADRKTNSLLVCGVLSEATKYAGTWHVRVGIGEHRESPSFCGFFEGKLDRIPALLRDASPTVGRYYTSMSTIPAYNPDDATDRLLAMSVISKLRVLKPAPPLPPLEPGASPSDPVAHLYRELASKRDEYVKIADFIEEHLSHERSTSFTQQVFAFQMHSGLKAIEILREFNDDVDAPAIPHE